MIDLEATGKRAVAEAARLWALDVYDPPKDDHSPKGEHSRAIIEGILKDAGWTWELPYKGDGQVEWCGLFVAACWRAAGIDPKWLATYFASTYRLDTWARYLSFDEKHPNARPTDDSPRRVVVEFTAASSASPIAPRAGDILMIGDGKPPTGDHICLVESYDADLHAFRTIEGNGVGLGPDGKRRQGIVRGVRNIGGSGYCARRLIRPAPSDLIA